LNKRLKTSIEARNKIEEMHKSLKLSNYATIVRLAIGLSLKDSTMPDIDIDDHGLEIRRDTLTGTDDFLFKMMISQHAGRYVPDEEYFPALLNGHIERGINKIYAQFKLKKNRDKFIKYLLGIK
jgi:DNA sulfur modification protein DndE